MAKTLAGRQSGRVLTPSPLDGAANEPAGRRKRRREGPAIGVVEALGEETRVARLRQAFGRMRDAHSLRQLKARAVVEACRAGGFERAVFFTVRGSDLVAENAYVDGDSGSAAAFLRMAQSEQRQLGSALLESEIVRRHRPILVDDARKDSGKRKLFPIAGGSVSYVGAPIMSEGCVVGILLADCHCTERRLDATDRDALWAFAEGVGYALECVALRERLNRQSDNLTKLANAAAGMLKPLQEAEIDLVSSDLVSIADLGLGASGVSGRSQMKVDAELTPREREVLSLMASGATNAVIATRLVISENTVKSHVKQILRKLGAGNRAEATSRFLAGSEIAPPALEPRAFRD